jgi:two-component system sensor histidine kinase RegB
MWFNFALSALLITYFVVKMANTLRRQEQVIASRREDDLRDEQILAVATLAAGTAHELGTPMATINMLVDELVAQYPNDDELSDDLLLLQQQIAHCRGILQKLVDTARQHSSATTTRIDAKQYLLQVIEHWQVMRPDAHYRLELPKQDAPLLEVDSTLEQAISNLLNNAADASPSHVIITASWSSTQLCVSVRDHGSGIALDIAEQLGKPFVTAKGKGLGLGLFLSHATIARYGGSIELFNHPEGGTLAELSIPLPCRWRPAPKAAP